jgi:uncharacterized membrane protein
VHSPEGRREYWRKCLTITAIVLSVWIGLTFLVGYYANEVHEAISILYAVLMGFYAWYISRQDRSYAAQKQGEQ